MAKEIVRTDNARLTGVLNELTGRVGGLRIEHADGRVEMVARPETRELTPEDLGMTMSELQARSYDLLRSQGYGPEAARLLMKGR